MTPLERRRFIRDICIRLAISSMAGGLIAFVIGEITKRWRGTGLVLLAVVAACVLVFVGRKYRQVKAQLVEYERRVRDP